MIDISKLERLDEDAQPPPWRHDGAGGMTVDDDFDNHLLDDVRNGDFVAAARNAMPPLLRFVRAMHEWDAAMQRFQAEQKEMESQGMRIDMAWAIEQCGIAQEKLDAATKILREEFDFGGGA